MFYTLTSYTFFNKEHFYKNPGFENRRKKSGIVRELARLKLKKIPRNRGR